MERVDHVPGQVLRPPAQLADHLHGMGYREPPDCGARGWVHLPDVWEEVVGSFFLLRERTQIVLTNESGVVDMARPFSYSFPLNCPV